MTCQVRLLNNACARPITALAVSATGYDRCDQYNRAGDGYDSHEAPVQSVV